MCPGITAEQIKSLLLTEAVAQSQHKWREAREELWKSKELQGERVAEESYYVSLKCVYKKYFKTISSGLFWCEPFISTSS